MGFLTGIEVIDRYSGLRVGLVYLLEEPGAGGREFAFNVLIRNRKNGKNIVTFTKSEDEILTEIGNTFPKENPDTLRNEIQVASLEKFYFWDSIVPRRWIGEEDFTIFDLKREGEVVQEFMNTFDDIQENSIVVVDSITDLYRASQGEIERHEFVHLMIGIRKLSLKKNILVLGLLTKDVLPRNVENQILAESDGIILFEWENYKGWAGRWIHFIKLAGLMPFLEREKVSRLQIRVDPVAGFVVSQYERVV